MPLPQDCFFASVTEASVPEFKGKPLVRSSLHDGLPGGKHGGERTRGQAPDRPRLPHSLPAACQAVCHSASAKGSGEVSTSNYEARKYGVRSGMFIRSVPAPA